MSEFTPTERPVYEALYGALLAWRSCARNWAAGGQNAAHYREMVGRWDSLIDSLVKKHMPSGSGFDNGTKLDRDTSLRRGLLVFDTAFHHMNEGGFYEGWSEHTVFVRPAFVGHFEIYKIDGRDRNQIKDMIADMFNSALVTMTSESLREHL